MVESEVSLPRTREYWVLIGNSGFLGVSYLSVLVTLSEESGGPEPPLPGPRPLQVAEVWRREGTPAGATLVCPGVRGSALNSRGSVLTSAMAGCVHVRVRV